MQGLLSTISANVEDELEAAVRRILHPPALAILDAGLARDAPCRFAFLGDSHTAGLRASVKERRYVDRIVAAFGGTTVDSPTAEFGELDPTPGVHGYNAGKNSATSANYAPPEVIASIAALDPVMVVHAIGANDYSYARSTDEFRANIQAVIDGIDALLTVPAVHVLLHTHQRQDAAIHLVPWAEFGKTLRDIARADPDRRLFIDASGPFAALDVFGTDPYVLGDVDNVHLADAGHGLLASTVLRHLGATMPNAGDPILAEDVLTATLSSTVGFTNNTLANITGLSVAVTDGNTYRVEQVLYASNAAGTTEDIKCGFSFPTGTLRLGVQGGTTGGVSGSTTTDMQLAFNAFTSGSTTISIGLSTSVTTIMFVGIYTCTASGTFQSMAAQATNGANTTNVAASSHLILTRL